MRFLAFIAIALTSYALACGPYSEIARGGQVEAARVAQEIACQKQITRFREGAAEGLSCEASKKRAAAEHPLCNLSFICPVRDAGAEGGVE